MKKIISLKDCFFFLFLFITCFLAYTTNEMSKNKNNIANVLCKECNQNFLFLLGFILTAIFASITLVVLFFIFFIKSESKENIDVDEELL